MNEQTYVEIENARIKAVTTAAYLIECTLDSNHRNYWNEDWLPHSQIMDEQLEDLQYMDAHGRLRNYETSLVVTKWIADKKGIPYV